MRCVQGISDPERMEGLEWSYGVDTFALGCILAETAIGRRLVSPDFETDRENLALIDRVFGPFPSEYARQINLRLPATFELDGRVSVIFPAFGIHASREEMLGPVVRVDDARPVAVSVFVCFVVILLTG